MAIIRTTIKIEDELLKTIKKIAIDKNASQNSLMNEYLRKGVNEELNSKKQNNNYSFKDMIGIVNTDETTNAVELKKKAQRGEY